MGRGIAALTAILAIVGLTGCGPGLTHRVQAPTPESVGGAPANPAVFDAMDAELLHAIGSTTLTNAELPAPAVRLPLLAWDDEAAPVSAVSAAPVSASAPSTWGGAYDAAVLTSTEAR